LPDLSSYSHGFWYTHAWVSNDVVATSVRRDPPAQRGLEQQATGSGARYWIFPPDYDQRVTAILPGTGSAPPLTKQ